MSRLTQGLRRYRRESIIGLLLATSILWLYSPARRFDFVNLDDGMNVSENPHVRAGLTRDSVRWALTSREDYWRPLTRLSHMADVELFGMDAGAHHRTNVLLHAGNALLLFAILRRMTGCAWRSAFVAAAFGLHPLRVESVAWITERKDVLSALFWLLTLWAYAVYAERPRLSRYLPVLALFLLGLTAKPMLMTLPFALLLLDAWPLGRWETAVGGRGFFGRRNILLVAEKLPLFALAFVSLAWTAMGQRQEGLAVDFTLLPLTARVGNALISYVAYLGMMVRPAGLAVLYPHIVPLPVWKAAGAAVLLSLITAAVLWKARRKPYLLTGWFWYAGALLPTAGLVQVGDQRMADRFTYLPMIGILIIIAWGVPEILGRWRHARPAMAAGAVVALATCAWGTARQLPVWVNTITLLEHALRAGHQSVVTYNSLGNFILSRGGAQKALGHFEAAVRLNPVHSATHNNMGIALTQLKRPDEAMKAFQTALRLKPDLVEAHSNLGVVLIGMRRYDEAAAQCREALWLDPGYAKAHHNLGIALANQNRFEEAIQSFRDAARLDPGNAATLRLLEAALAAKDRQRAMLAPSPSPTR